MRHVSITFLRFILLTSFVVDSFEPISTIAGLTVVMGASYFVQKLYISVYETCNDNWITFSSYDLKTALNRKVFGQHVASQVILKAVTAHMQNPNPKKPLVLSLHGLAGTGKNLVSQVVAESIYHKGMDSGFVHLFTATTHFPHQKHLDTYKEQLQMWVKGNVTKCPRSMFIFDEMDKMQAGLIDSIKPNLDFYRNLDGVSYRQAIFIFLSNAGGKKIAEVVLNHNKTGQDREKIELKDLERAVTLSLLNNADGGFWHTSLIDKHLVDVYVPFLPLEQKHVVQCGLAEMAAKNMTPDWNVADRMAQDFHYFPDKERLFSTQGCKLVSTRLHLYV